MNAVRNQCSVRCAALKKPWGYGRGGCAHRVIDYLKPSPNRFTAAWKPSASKWRISCAPPGAADGEQIRAAADRQREVTLATPTAKPKSQRAMVMQKPPGSVHQIFWQRHSVDGFYRSLEAYRPT